MKRLCLFKAVLLLFVIGWTQIVFGLERLTMEDVFGKWYSDVTVIDGESQILNIFKNNTAYFQRKFESGKSQDFGPKRSSLTFFDDLTILDFGSKSGGYGYKLVLSGWKSEGGKKLYGMMFMYRDGKQFNGIPVSFKPQSQ